MITLWRHDVARMEVRGLFWVSQATLYNSSVALFCCENLADGSPERRLENDVTPGDDHVLKVCLVLQEYH